MLFITVVGNPAQQTQGHSCGIWWLGALANFILISHPVNTYKRCFVWCCLYAGSGHIPTETPPSTQSLLGHREQISGWSYTLMSTSHCWRCWNTLYIYKEDLLWVWTGWGVSIISTNRGSKCESMHNSPWEHIIWLEQTSWSNLNEYGEGFYWKKVLLI